MFFHRSAPVPRIRSLFARSSYHFSWKRQSPFAIRNSIHVLKYFSLPSAGVCVSSEVEGSRIVLRSAGPYQF